MQELDQHSITDVALEQMSSTTDFRLKEIMAVVVRHLHEIAREVDRVGIRRAPRLGSMNPDGRVRQGGCRSESVQGENDVNI